MTRPQAPPWRRKTEKLTPEQQQRVRTLYRKGIATQLELAKDFGVSVRTINEIIKAEQVQLDWHCALCEATLKGTMVKRSKRDKAICTYCEDRLVARGEKRCRKCNILKSLEEFGVDQSRLDGHHPYCVTCLNAKSLAHYYSKADYYREKNRQYKARQYAEGNNNVTPEQIRENTRRYRERHPDRWRASYTAYDAAHRTEKAAAQRARYHALSPEERYQRHKQYVYRRFLRKKEEQS